MTTLVRKKQSGLASYAVLLEKLRGEFATAQQAIDAVKGRTYWNTGWYISRHVLLDERLHYSLRGQASLRPEDWDKE